MSDDDVIEEQFKERMTRNVIRTLKYINTLLEKEDDVKTQYGIDYYFNTEKDEDEVCINVDFNKT